MLTQRWRVRNSLPIMGAAGLLGACSLLIEGSDGERDGQGASGGTNPVAAGANDGAGASDGAAGANGGASASDGAAGASDGMQMASSGGSAPIGPSERRPELPVLSYGPDAGAVPQPTPETGTDAGPAEEDPSPGSVLYLAFIEDPAETEASLRLVSAREALSSTTSEAAPEWRRTLRPQDQAGNALDFAWSPDGRRLALRYEAIDGARLAFFEAPEWQELATEEIDNPASQPPRAASASYQWSPDSRTLAAELSSTQGPAVGGYSVAEGRAVALPPVEFSGPLESMAWLSATQLFVVQPESGEREIVTLTLSQGSFDDQILLPVTTYVHPLALRRIPTGILGASVESGSLLYFWPETSAELGTIYTGRAYVSGGQSFVAETDSSLVKALLYPLGELQQPSDTLPDCAVVLAWVDGPTSGSLAGSKIACVRSENGTATITVYALDAAGTRTTITLDDPTLGADLALEANWEEGARGFSSGGQWLALATVQHDLLVDLRAPDPKYYAETASSTGSTARGFSPSGSYLLQQRGLKVDFTVLAPGGDEGPIPFPLIEAAQDAIPCDAALHVANWCGAPDAAKAASARWALHEDVAVFLTRDEGLSLLAFTDAGDGLLSNAVSTCGAACITKYELGP
jgi:hypothetical protein